MKAEGRTKQIINFIPTQQHLHYSIETQQTEIARLSLNIQVFTSYVFLLKDLLP